MVGRALARTSQLGASRSPRRSKMFDREPPALVYVNGLERWRAYRDWPPAGSRLVLFLSPESQLTPSSSPAETAVHLHPAVLTGSCAGLLDPLGTGLGRPEDQHADDLGSLVFETEVLTEQLELVGHPELNLRVQAGALEDLRLVAKLCDVSPEGRSTLVTSGWQRAPCPAEARDEMTVDLRCFPVSVVVPAGHRLRVSVSSSDFPRLWPAPGDGSFALLLGGAQASKISLTVVSGDADGGEDWTDRVP